MAYFPLFVDLENKKILLVGGGKEALEKWERIEGYGPKVTLVAESIDAAFRESEQLKLLHRSFRAEDLEGVELCICGDCDEETAAAVSELCRARKIPVNVVDKRDKCDFIFPTLLHKGKLTAGISTSGASPFTAIRLRNELEQLLPDRTEEILDYLDAIRPTVKERIETFAERKSFLRTVTNACFEQGRPLTAEEEASLWLAAGYSQK